MKVLRALCVCNTLQVRQMGKGNRETDGGQRDGRGIETEEQTGTERQTEGQVGDRETDEGWRGRQRQRDGQEDRETDRGKE